MSYEAEDGVDSPPNLQIPMAITPIQAPSDIPSTNMSMAASPCGCRLAERSEQEFSGVARFPVNDHVTVFG